MQFSTYIFFKDNLQHQYQYNWTTTTVNRSQMDIKCKTCDIQIWKGIYLSTSYPLNCQ
jgi:hypothetical protein